MEESDTFMDSYNLSSFIIFINMSILFSLCNFLHLVTISNGHVPDFSMRIRWASMRINRNK